MRWRSSSTSLISLLQTRSCKIPIRRSPQGLSHDCWAAIVWAEWSPASLALADRQSLVLDVREPHPAGKWSTRNNCGYPATNLSSAAHRSSIFSVNLFVPGSKKWRLVFPSADTPTDTMTDFENVGRVQRRRRAATFFLWTSNGTYRRSFWVLRGVTTLKIFSSVNQIKFTKPAE